MYVLVTCCGRSSNVIQCRDLEEACRTAWKLRDQFCNIQRDNKIIYNKLEVDDLGNVVFENVWARELLE